MWTVDGSVSRGGRSVRFLGWTVDGSVSGGGRSVRFLGWTVRRRGLTGLRVDGSGGVLGGGYRFGVDGLGGVIGWTVDGSPIWGGRLRRVLP